MGMKPLFTELILLLAYAPGLAKKLSLMSKYLKKLSLMSKYLKKLA